MAFSIATHLHADFVTGSRELARFGVEVVASAGAELGWATHTLAGGETLDLGGLTLRAIATGATPLNTSPASGIAPTRENGMHALRHFYASVLLDGGESIRTLADYLGHADSGFTLRVYTHLAPSSVDRARAAIDRALGVSKVCHTDMHADAIDAGQP